MKSGVLLGVFTGLVTAGYFGYGYWQERETKKKAAAIEAARSSSGRLGPGVPVGGTAAATPDAEPEALPTTGRTDAGLDAPVIEHGVPISARAEMVVVPDLIGLDEAKARAALAKAGFPPGRLSIVAHYTCSYTDDKKMRPKGQICSQSPEAGAKILPLVAMEVAVEHDDYESGQANTPFEWKRMPKLVGLTEAEARAVLAKKGFAADAFVVEHRSGCGKKGRVCLTNPAAEARAVTRRRGSIVVGQ